METLTRSASVHYRARQWRESGQKVALVPTRGTLHRGHMSLVAAAQELADHVIVSIFSDPPCAEAGAGEGQEADLALLENVGADLVFRPPPQEMFPIGRALAAIVTLPELADDLEGADVVGCPTWRDGEGLALAGVNRSLTDAQRAVAPRLHATLVQIAAEIDSGARDYGALERRAALLLGAAGFTMDYCEIRQSADLARPRSGARDLVLLAAVRLGAVRLIDSQPVRVIDRY